MKRIVETLEAEGPLVYFIGAALMIFTAAVCFFGGTYLVGLHPDFAHQCVMSGGTYSDITKDIHDPKSGDLVDGTGSETCTVPIKH